MAKKQGGEVFYLDENGKPQDADLHKEILNVDKATEKRVTDIGKQVARDCGMSEEAIRALYPDD